jgi:hypothetical protein
VPAHGAALAANGGRLERLHLQRFDLQLQLSHDKPSCKTVMAM